MIIIKAGFTPTPKRAVHKSLVCGFTLLEILIVVAVIAILTVISILMLNPGEARKKTRDAQRIRDLTIFQHIVDQYVSDLSVNTSFTSNSNTSSSITCINSWFGRDVCQYAIQVPIDPVNKTTTVIKGNGVYITTVARYRVKVDAQNNYKICTRMEAKISQAKLTSDGGNGDDFYEVFNNASALDCL